MKILIDGVNIFLSSYINYLFTGKPISGSGAGLRPIGQDPNFVADLRESFNIAVPVLSDEEEDKAMSRPFHSGNGRNKWPNPLFVGPQWRNVVRATIVRVSNV